MSNVRLRHRFPAGPLVVIALAVCWLWPSSAVAQAPCPSPVPTSIPAPNLDAPAATLIPSDVCIPASFPGNPIAFFDDYSWRAFIALVWPALSGQRGKPDPNQPLTAVDVPLRVLIPSFMISELRRSFEIGFMLFIPFLIIDLVVSSILMSMGMMMVPPITISLPFKLIFFVLVDGWRLIAGSLIQSFATGPPPH